MDSLEKKVSASDSGKGASRERFPIVESKTEKGLEVAVSDLHGGVLKALIADQDGKRIVRLIEYVPRTDIEARRETSLELFGRIMDKAQEAGAEEIQIPVDSSIPGAEQMVYITDITELLGEEGAEEVARARAFYGSRETKRAGDAFTIKVSIETYRKALAQRLAEEANQQEAA